MTYQQQDSHYLIEPGGFLRGEITVPGDKSISHRAIILGSLADGVTTVRGFLPGDDTLATLAAFRNMGVCIDGPEDDKLTIYGAGMHGLKPPTESLYMGNAGTAMRLLSGLLAAQRFNTTLTGDKSLTKRPMQRVIDPLVAMGANIVANSNRAPLHITGGNTLASISYTLSVASAQVKSCLLLAGMYADGSVQVIEPVTTRDHTERMLATMGYPVSMTDNAVAIKGGGKLVATNIIVPADISSAAFFMVGATIAKGSDITLKQVGINPTRIGVINILRLMGADIVLLNEAMVSGEPIADIRVCYAPLSGIVIPQDQVSLAIDEFPALLIAAACAQGQTVLTGATELRVKESDRIQAMADGLTVLGVDAQPTAEGMIIKGGMIGSGIVDSYHDHRIAMAFAIAGLCANGRIQVNHCANVATSFPNFVRLATQAGLDLAVLDD